MYELFINKKVKKCLVTNYKKNLEDYILTVFLCLSPHSHLFFHFIIRESYCGTSPRQ